MRAFRNQPLPGSFSLGRVTPLEARPRWAAKLFRCPADVWLVEASFIYLIVILLMPSWWVIALGIWWISNTVSHNFIHQPFFRSGELNRCFALYLTVITGIPQRLWRDRHLAHHAGMRWRLRFPRELIQQTA